MSRFLLVLLCSACFGTGLTISRMGLTQFDVFGYTALRFVVALLAFVVFNAARRGVSWPRSRQFWGLSAVFGITGTAIPMLAIISSLQFMSSGMAAIVAAVGPTFAVIFAHLFLRDERITSRKLLGIGIAFAGAAFLVTQRETGLGDAAVNFVGYGMLLGGLVISYGSIIMARKYLRSYDIYQVVSVQILTATAIVLPLAWSEIDFSGVEEPGTAIFSVVYGGVIGTFAAFLTRFQLIKQYGATDAAMIDYVVPVMATAAGILLLDEKFTATMAIGMAIILLGVRVVQSARAKA